MCSGHVLAVRRPAYRGGMPKHSVQPPEWIDGAPIRVTESVDIAASPSAVWAHIVDHESWPEWFTALDSVERIGSGDGVGSGRRVVAMRLPLDEEFTAWDVDEHFAFAVTASKIVTLDTLAESVRLEQIDGGTRVTYRQGVQGKPGLGWAMRLLWKRPAGQLADAVQQLKLRIESESESG